MLLEVENVTKSFGGLMALNGVSLTVEPLETIGLIGPNGSGKSTLFNMITGTLPLTSGKIRFDGQNISNLSSHRVSTLGIARTFQTVRPFANLTVLQNVTAGCMYGSSQIRGKSAAEQKAYEVLKQVDLADEAHLPVNQLNIISRKWLEVARALATGPKLLLLDEFMAGLNPAEVKHATDFVKRLKELGITVIIVEHIVKAIMNCSDRVVVLNAGEKIAEDSPTAIINNPTVIRAYLGSDYAEN